MLHPSFYSPVQKRIICIDVANNTPKRGLPKSFNHLATAMRHSTQDCKVCMGKLAQDGMACYQMLASFEPQLRADGFYENINDFMAAPVVPAAIAASHHAMIAAPLVPVAAAPLVPAAAPLVPAAAPLVPAAAAPMSDFLEDGELSRLSLGSERDPRDDELDPYDCPELDPSVDFILFYLRETMRFEGVPTSDIKEFRERIIDFKVDALAAVKAARKAAKAATMAPK
jgi:hypothetical protein